MNALIGKDVLNNPIYPTIEVITRITFGEDEKVFVHETDEDAPNGTRIIREMSMDDYYKRNRMDMDDPYKSKTIEQVQLQLPGEGIGSALVQLVELPIMVEDNSWKGPEIVRRFENNANAILFVMNSTIPFTLDEKEYIERHYAGRHMGNIFFVFNRFDRLTEQAQEEVKAMVPQWLHDVFIDENGKFDQELFESRVFYTDAYHSLKARTGEKIKTPYGMMECDDSVSGVPELQAALSDFLIRSCRNLLHNLVEDLARLFVIASNRCYDEVNWLREEEKRAAKQIEASPSDARTAFEKWKNTVEIRQDAEVRAGKVRQTLLDSVNSLWKAMEGRELTGVQFWQMALQQS